MTIPSASVETSDISVAKTQYSSLKLNGSATQSGIDIIDIRHDAVEINLKDEIHKSLRPDRGLKQLPTLLLYSERGLQLFEEITYLEEYYLTNAEIDALTKSADEIAGFIASGSMVIELGSGNLRKVSILLQALERAGKDVDYYALDLSLDELRRTLEQVPAFQHVRCHGLHGTYDDGLEWLKLPGNRKKPKCVMSLGSSIGNFHRNDAADFLRGFQQVLQSSDSMLIGVDATNDPGKVYHAYNDCEGTTHRFILNGLLQANSVLGEDLFHVDDWKVIGEYVHDVEGGRHQAFYAPVRDIEVLGVKIKAGERVQVEQSLKYSDLEAQTLWKKAGLEEVTKWSATHDSYSIHFLRKQKMEFTTDPRAYAASTVPTFEDWKGLWAVWDVATRRMIPDDELLGKPIKLRNACIFYLGHIPTFLEIQLNKVTGLAPCEPLNYPEIFERGIDPDVDNPENCHDHSEIPEEWPPLDEILAYQQQVRTKVETLYRSEDISRSVGRALWIGFEHEIMHLETLFYMLLQSDKTHPPTSKTPDFEALARAAKTARVPNQWFKIPEQEISIGLDDPEDNSGGDVHFGWDNEKPRRTIQVGSFEAYGRPITNEEYAVYLEREHISKVPASWKVESGYTNGFTNGHNGISNGNGTSDTLTKAYLEGKSIRTVYGLVPLEYALDWPVFASYDELAGCASWMGGRIPTAEEARSIYSFAEDMKKQNVQQQTTTVPAVNGHLVNNGVEESPPSKDASHGEGWSQLFTDLDGANVGFKNWHPVAVTGQGHRLGGQSEMGGVWEWTSSVLTKHEGFEPMPLYPAYTADFFDGKHNIILGGSWATHPRIAGRKTFVNWYQRNYPYVWAGARLVRDL